MKITIAYHKETDRTIEKVATVEAEFIHTRGINIDSIVTGTLRGEEITIYPNEKPSRIDQQGNVVFLISREFAEQHPEPYGHHSNTKIFGEPTTIYMEGV